MLDVVDIALSYQKKKKKKIDRLLISAGFLHGKLK